jgi:hypothetical protein
MRSIPVIQFNFFSRKVIFKHVRKIAKITISFLTSVRPSARMK